MNYSKTIQDIFKFNRRFIPEELTDEERSRWLQRFVMYTSDELMEVLGELPFKHWKDYNTFEINDQRVLDELADVLIFTFGMVDILGYDDQDIMAAIDAKNQVNERRQEEGY